MKKIIKLTESDLTRLVKRVIQESTNLTPERLNSRKGQGTKLYAQALNKKYKLNLPLDGNWRNPDYEKAFKQYIEEKGLRVWVCKKGDGYCNDEDEGEVTVHGDDFKKLDSLLRAELGGGDGPKDIKVFQDWLDTYYPNWLKGGKLNKGKGYGTFGPNTKAAWEKYKSVYKEN